jgi:transposase
MSEMIALEFKRGALGVSVTWPVSAAADCAAWLREVLR